MLGARRDRPVCTAMNDTNIALEASAADLLDFVLSFVVLVLSFIEDAASSCVLPMSTEEVLTVSRSTTTCCIAAVKASKELNKPEKSIPPPEGCAPVAPVPLANLWTIPPLAYLPTLFILFKLPYPILLADFLLTTNSPGVSKAGTVSVPTDPPLANLLNDIPSNLPTLRSFLILLIIFNKASLVLLLLASALTSLEIPSSPEENSFCNPSLDLPIEPELKSKVDVPPPN